MLEYAREFANKVVLITGAGGGIGQALVKAFGERGASLVAADLTDEMAGRAVALAEHIGAPCRPVTGDVADADTGRRWVDSAVAQFGHLDVLINNAGIGGPVNPVQNMDLDGWRRTLDVNLTGTLLCSQAAVNVMLPQKSGVIINVSSNVGKRGHPTRAAYVASKWGMIGLTQTLALEVARDGIRVHAVCPGPVEGERVEGFIQRQALVQGITPDEVRAEWIASMPIGRMITAEEVAEVVVFLASSRASGMTGQAINITGGMVMH
jgi:NAD(P)-dependent dehydrogenase (short-subunit alcohol dehydrogenase family)